MRCHQELGEQGGKLAGLAILAGETGLSLDPASHPKISHSHSPEALQTSKTAEALQNRHHSVGLNTPLNVLRSVSKACFN